MPGQRMSIVLFMSCLLAACGPRQPAPDAATSAQAIVIPPEVTTRVDDVAGDPVAGLRVATRVGCNGCHGEDAGGEVFHEDEENGRIVAPNLTQRRNLYDDAGLAALLHEGRTHDGHVPWGMPIMMFQHLSDQEVRDITAWLRALPAVENPNLPDGKWSDALAKATADGTHPWLVDMRPSPGNQPPTTTPTEPLALGKHLAMTSCSECHGADLNGWPGDDAPSLIVAKAYSGENFARLMKTGITANGKESKTGMMSGVARWRFSRLSDNEVRALKLYLDAR